MVRWIETARANKFANSSWLPEEPDVVKSALLERLYNGLDPLVEPPPLASSFPWYALVEDRGPHSISDVSRDTVRPDVIWALEYPYQVIQELGTNEFLVRDGRKRTPYRFRLWLDKTSTSRARNGNWLIQNIVFCKRKYKFPDPDGKNILENKQAPVHDDSVKIKSALVTLGKALLDVRGMAIELRRNILLPENAAGQFEMDLLESLKKIDEFFRMLGGPQAEGGPQSAIDPETYDVISRNGGTSSQGNIGEERPNRPSPRTTSLKQKGARKNKSMKRPQWRAER